MTEDNNSKAKICVNCSRMLPLDTLDTLVCPSCGGIIFETVDLGGANE